MIIIIIFSSVSHASSCFQEIWANIKYDQDLTNDERLYYFDEFLKEATAKTKEDRLWLLMTSVAKLNLESKLKAQKELALIVDALEKELVSMQTPTDYMAAGVLSYLYAKAPSWPKSIGSVIKAKKWM